MACGVLYHTHSLYYIQVIILCWHVYQMFVLPSQTCDGLKKKIKSMRQNPIIRKISTMFQLLLKSISLPSASPTLEEFLWQDLMESDPSSLQTVLPKYGQQKLFTLLLAEYICIYSKTSISRTPNTWISHIPGRILAKNIYFYIYNS